MIKPALASLWNRETGSATVEFAVVAPIILLLLFGIVEFGRVMSVQHLLNTAAREGARVAVLPGASTGQVNAKIAEVLTGAGISSEVIEISPADVSSANRNDPITVRVRVTYESIAWVGGIVPGLAGRQIQGEVVMRKEGFV
ncbi:MAG: DUF4320 family protein [bacterium]|nr:DUF4320 family protein [bacterium]